MLHVGVVVEHPLGIGDGTHGENVERSATDLVVDAKPVEVAADIRALAHRDQPLVAEQKLSRPMRMIGASPSGDGGRRSMKACITSSWLISVVLGTPRLPSRSISPSCKKILT